MNKLKNILSFVIIFLSGDLNLLYQSPDYILEKFYNFFGDDITIKKHEESKFFKKYNLMWNTDDYRINSILLFVINVYNYNNNLYNDIDPFDEEYWYKYDNIDDDDYITNILITPSEYFELFDKWIDNHNNIIDIERDGLHTLLKTKLLDRYIDMNKDL